MRKELHAHPVRVVLLSSISEVSEIDSGSVVVTGSHGGASVVDYALRYPIIAAFFNDAGVGKEEAGIASLRTLEEMGVAAGTVSHRSARIGDADDSYDSGRISHLNMPAHKLGFCEDALLREALSRCFTDRE